HVFLSPGRSRMNKRMSSAALPIGSSADAFTDVELIWIEKTVEHWIRFGVADREVFLDRHRRVLSFRPGSVLARVRWSANAYGTVVSRLDIFGAPLPGQACQTL